MSVMLGERAKRFNSLHISLAFLGSCERLLREEEGQAVVEYILLLSLCAMIAAGLARALVAVMDSGILMLGGQLEKDLKTGRAPLNVWQN